MQRGGTFGVSLLLLAGESKTLMNPAGKLKIKPIPVAHRKSDTLSCDWYQEGVSELLRGKEKEGRKEERKERKKEKRKRKKEIHLFCRSLCWGRGSFILSTYDHFNPYGWT